LSAKPQSSTHTFDTTTGRRCHEWMCSGTHQVERTVCTYQPHLFYASDDIEGLIVYRLVVTVQREGSMRTAHKMVKPHTSLDWKPCKCHSSGCNAGLHNTGVRQTPPPPLDPRTPARPLPYTLHPTYIHNINIKTIDRCDAPCTYQQCPRLARHLGRWEPPQTAPAWLR
jgi:hypothetical protein